MFNKKNLTITIISIITLAIISGGVFWYLNQNNEEVVVVPEDNKQDEVVKDDSKSVILNDDKIDTSDWKTYRNEEYGFEVKYPEEWGVDTKEQFYLGKKENFLILNPPQNNGHNFMFIYRVNENNTKRCEEKTNIDQINIGGYQTYTAVIRHNPNLNINNEVLDTYSYCVKTNNNNLNLTYTPSLPNDKNEIKKEIFNAIINSLDFIK